MSDYTFNIAKGRPAALHDAVNDSSPANSALVIIPLSAQGTEAEARDYDTVAAVLAGSSNEQTSGNWSRKTLTDTDLVASVVNDTSNRCELAIPAVVWSDPAPSIGSNVVALLIAYDPDTTTGSDSGLIPISSHTFAGTADGNPITLNAGDYMHSGPEADEEPPPTPDPEPDGITGDWILDLDENFDDLDMSMWRRGWFQTPTSNPVNSYEDAGYHEDHAVVSGGNLVLSMTEDAILCPDSVTRPWTGGLVSSNPHDGRPGGGYEFGFGAGFSGIAAWAIEVRAFILAEGPGDAANWSAIWTNGQSPWPSNGEIDIMEALGSGVSWHYHGPGPVDEGHAPAGDWTGWHTFAYRRTAAGELRFFYDGVQVGDTLTDVVDSPHYIILNHALFDAGDGVEGDILIDYVRVWKELE